MHSIIKNKFNISDKIYNICIEVEEEINDLVKDIEYVEKINQSKVLKAFSDNRISDAHFAGTTGYGYDDMGREALDAVYAEAFGAEDALVRHSIVSGTHALSLCLFGILRPGDEMLAITGTPYDTLEEIIGIRGEKGGGSLKDIGISYNQTNVIADNLLNCEIIKDSIKDNTRLIYIQRSRGYEWRKSLSIEDIKKIINTVKSINNDIVCLVDNCYGEFVETLEPTNVGADLIAGSLIKNPGGGIAPGGGYIAGKKDLIELISYKLTAPGIGRECGPSHGMNRLMFQGFFMAPHIVSQSIKGATFCGAIFKKLGFDISPDIDEHRSDIIQAIKFGNPEHLLAFCQGIQKGSPIDSFVEPQPWDMPGYDSQVIMAAGAFVQGASIELSADAPIRKPYIAYLQGGLTYEHVKLGIMISLQHMSDKGIEI